MSTSYTSQTSLGLSFSLADKNASISKAFLSSASAVYLKLGCLVMSYLSERKGRTPRSWRIHLPPSITASSSWLISSLPQSQVVNSQKASGIKEIHLLYRLPSCFVLILFTVLPLIWDKKKQETFSDFPLSKTVKFF